MSDNVLCTLVCRNLSCVLIGASLLLGGQSAWADAPVAKIEVFPPDVELSTSRDSQRMVVMATRTDGVTLDVTGQAQFKPANPALV
ncbi:MAG: hypothetical protein ABUL64_01210, partial [Singulisphaera sp.]